MTWIPVSERLPEVGARVFVYCPRYSPKENIATRVLSNIGHEGHFWHFDNDDDDWCDGSDSAVTHWQPLPEPPEKEGAWSKS